MIRENEECLFIDESGNVKKCIFMRKLGDDYEFKGVDDKLSFFLSSELASKMIVKVDEIEKSDKQDLISDFYASRIKKSSGLLREKISKFNESLKSVDSSAFSSMMKDLKINNL